jgi:hypothetical protein
LQFGSFWIPEDGGDRLEIKVTPKWVHQSALEEMIPA